MMMNDHSHSFQLHSLISPHHILRNNLSTSHVWSSHIKEVIFSEQVIQKRVAEMAIQISQDYHGKDILVVGLLNGAFMFVSDVLRRLTCSYQLDFMVVSSYGR
jgi:hypoxanthine-guanine phosphoribosyltransferase